jgi:hypothetical protein
MVAVHGALKASSMSAVHAVYNPRPPPTALVLQWSSCSPGGWYYHAH